MSVGVNGSKQIDADLNLQQFFDHVFDANGQIVEPNGCDTAYYLTKLDCYNMSETDKTEMIHTLWNAIDSVLRMQFGFDSLTHIMNEKAAMRAENDLAMIQSSQFRKDKNEGA